MPAFYKWLTGNSSSIKKLLLWKQGDEDDRWAEKAIEALIKKLKNNKNSLNELEQILTDKNSFSPCITFPRSLDGRLQILHRKGLPHVIYCRIFRWPDLQSQYEIQPVPHCEYAYSKSLPEVCINPYHYERIEAEVPPPVLIPRARAKDEELLAQPNPSIYHNACSSNPLYYQFPSQIIPQSEYSNYSSACGVIPISIPFINDANWCAICYYEQMIQVGEIFRANKQTITIDGYAHPISNGVRFSLAACSNVRRSPESDAVLSHIGSGIQLFYRSGDVFLENVSSSSVFVQSANLNFVKNFHSRAVVRVSSGSSLQLFYANEFAQILSNTVCLGYQPVNELSKQCDVFISFVKGWGNGYSRQELTACPCWLSVRLNTPLCWLDRILSKIGCPKDPISSYT